MRGGQSLAEALETYLAEWSERTGIAVETWALPSTDVPSRIGAGVLAAMREALGNVEAHSGARDRKSTRLNSSHQPQSRMPSSA